VANAVLATRLNNPARYRDTRPRDRAAQGSNSRTRGESYRVIPQQAPAAGLATQGGGPSLSRYRRPIMAKKQENEQPDLRVVGSVDTTNPFSNLGALRCAQDYEEFLGGEVNAVFAVRTLKEAMHLRVNPDPEYTLLGQYTVTTKQGTYFVFRQFRDAL